MEHTICIFGDSIVRGAWDREKGGRVQRLRTHFETKNFDVFIYNCGVSGDTTETLLKRFLPECEARKPTIIVFAIGTNDDAMLQNNQSQIFPEQFMNNVQELITQAKAYTEDIIFLGLTPVDETKTTPVAWDEHISYTGENMRKYDQKLQEICGLYSLPFVQVSDVLTLQDLEDGLHPTATGHEKIYLKIKEALLPYLSRS